MSSNVRSSSVGAQPRPKKLFTSRAESVAAAALDVRCACQFFQTTSLLPERVNPVGSRPTSSLGYSSRPQSRCLEHDQHIFEPDLQRSNLPTNEFDQLQDDLGSSFSFGEVVGDTDYYAESVISSRPNSPTLRQQPHDHQHYPSDEENASPLNLPGSQLSLNTSINPRPLQQKDPSKSVLLQRRTSQMVSEHLPAHVAQIDPTKSVLLQRRASQRSMESVAIKQRDPSTSSLLRKRLSQSRTLPEPGQFTETPYSFKPIAPEPIIPMIQPIVQKLAAPPPAITSYPRGPYPGEAYPDHYDEPVVAQKPAPMEDEKSFGIGIVELLSLGTSLVQRREQRYVERSNEDIRGRSRRSRKEKAEKEKTDKEERERRKAEAKAEREQKRKDDRQMPEPDGQPLVSSQATQQIIEQQITERAEEAPAQQPAATSPLVYIGQNIYIQDQPNIAPPANMEAQPAQQVSQAKESPLKDTAPISVIDNTKISVTANSLISSLMMSSRQPKPVEPVAQTSEEPPPVVNYHETINVPAPVIEKTTQPEPSVVPFMRQRDPSQSSLLRSRYSTDRDVPMPGTPIIRQRDPSTSSLLRSRYSVDKEQTSSPITVQPSTPFMRQRDPSQSSLLRKRLSESMEPAPPPASILAVAIATTGPFGSQQSLQHSDNFIRQKDPTTSSLMQKRMHERSHSQDNYSPAEKISKTVSFEYDKQLMTGAYDASGMASKAEVMQRMTKMSTEMRDRMDWIERTYNMR